ncbi:hypothetical protein BKA58DRAFT_437176 [Alternaria rosae]|uniref:uncharacterized protein n=1 Tax=Alternaria rosae TaxID=1187941 RepID=UPI001E8DEFB4|nr:uncharacterized protein BKA58DRAFT_437176 [Alternaria rosae]KAH6875187.1 hypothetical protein BKA58DRAFT_437176 [Alternaria rosae]
MTSAAWDREKELTEWAELLKRAATTEEGDLIATENHFNSPILCLPGEIRNEIYKYICRSSTVRYGKEYDERSEGPVTACRFTQTFLLTCKQFYSEAITLMYGLATFEVSSYEEWLSRKSLNSKYCSLITSLSVDSHVVSTAMRMTQGGTYEEYEEDLHPKHMPGKYFSGVERVHIDSPDWLGDSTRDVLRKWFEKEDLQVTGDEVPERYLSGRR